MLPIVKSQSIKVEGIVVLIYGQPGTGKTTLAMSAKKPLLFNFDKGQHRAKNMSDKDIFDISSWEQVVTSFPTLAQDLAPYDTLVLDTVNTNLDFIRIYLENKDMKLKKNKLQMYGQLKDEFHSFLFRLTSLKKDVIMISHADTAEVNGQMKSVPQITGGSRDIVWQKADIVGYSWIENRLPMLDFNATDYNDGKNSPDLQKGLPHWEANDHYMADLLSQAHKYFNDKVATNNVLELAMKGHKLVIDDIINEAGLYEALGNIKTDTRLNKEAMMILFEKVVKHAHTLGYDYDKSARTFVNLN